MLYQLYIVISVHQSCQNAKETGWNAVGHVSKITANEEVALELRGPQQVDSKSTHGTA